MANEDEIQDHLAYLKRVNRLTWWHGWIWGMVAGLIVGVITHILVERL